MVETRSSGKAAAGEPSDLSELTEKTPSPVRTSEPALLTDLFHSDPSDALDRIGSLEKLAREQQQATFDLSDLLRELRDSVDALNATRSAPPDVGGTQNLIQTLRNEAKLQANAAKQPTTAPARNRIKPGTPPDFDGDREKGRAFLNSCRLYIRLCATEFADEQAKIHWVLSYMKSGRASTFADRALSYEDRTGGDRFRTWNDFRKAFVAMFCPEDEATSARMRLEGVRYFQGRRTANDYIDEFSELVDKSEYTEELAIVIKFRRGLDPELQNKIAEARVDRPADDDVEGWCEAARRLDRNRLANEAFNGTITRRTTTTNGPSQRGVFPRAPVPSQAPPRFPLPANPRAPETSRDPAALTCFRCKQPGHTIRDCPKRHDVRALTLEELEEIVQARYAELDVVSETVAVTEKAEEPEMQEEDFRPHDE